MTAPPKPVPFFAAAAVILLAIFLFDIMGAIIKFLGQEYPVQQISFFRNFFGLMRVALIRLPE